MKYCLQKVACQAAVDQLSSLQLRPDDFGALLEAEYGFRLLRELTPQHPSPGFSRPVLVFKKQLSA